MQGCRPPCLTVGDKQLSWWSSTGCCYAHHLSQTRSHSTTEHGSSNLSSLACLSSANCAGFSCATASEEASVWYGGLMQAELV